MLLRFLSRIVVEDAVAVASDVHDCPIDEPVHVHCGKEGFSRNPQRELEVGGLGAEDFTEEELEELTQLDAENRIPMFLEENTSPTNALITAFIADLRSEGYTIDERYIRRLITNRLNRTLNDPPPFDLETDIVLQRAVEEIMGSLR